MACGKGVDHGAGAGSSKESGNMSEATARTAKPEKYLLNIEGEEVPWDQDTITTEQIAELGGWDISQGVIEVDQHNVERTLAPGEVIEIKPGHGFGKKHRWKRG
jgi:hypothetical protein